MFRSGGHMWRSTLYLNMTVAPATITGAGAGFGFGLRKCHPAKIAMRTAAPAAIGIKGNLLLEATDAEVAAACGSRTKAGSECCCGTTIVPELVDSGAAIAPDCCETAGEAITPDCCETTGAAITADCGVTAGTAGAAP